jgi:hypothetical protein
MKQGIRATLPGFPELFKEILGGGVGSGWPRSW